MSIKIILADDHNIVRNGLKYLINNEPDIKVIGEADNGIEVVRLVKELSPDIVIMDITMPGLNGMEATRKIVSKNPEVKVIALSIHSNSRFIAGMLSAGASGYLLKDCLFDELINAIKIVYKKGTFLSHSITGKVVKDYVSKRSVSYSSFSTILSSRECEVLQLIAEGNNVKETATQLHISIKTVESHRRHIMNKLDIHNIADLIKYAIREGFTSIES